MLTEVPLAVMIRQLGHAWEQKSAHNFSVRGKNAGERNGFGGRIRSGVYGRVKSETPRLQGTEPPHPDLLLSPVHYSLVYLPSLEE